MSYLVRIYLHREKDLAQTWDSTVKEKHWRKALDEGQNVGALAMDMFKAFDEMPHPLIVVKLHAYTVPAAWKFIISYLKNRLQRVKLHAYRSQLVNLNCDVPQGFVLGPSLFNISINDLFFLQMCSILLNMMMTAMHFINIKTHWSTFWCPGTGH